MEDTWDAILQHSFDKFKYFFYRIDQTTQVTIKWPTVKATAKFSVSLNEIHILYKDYG